MGAMSLRLGLRLPLLILAMSISSDAAAQARQAAASPEPIRYTLSFPAPQTHYVEVEATVPTRGRPQIELEMAVWTPGSYLVREFSRHVEDVSGKRRAARIGRVEKTAKNRWRVQTGSAPSVTVRYRVYGREMSVRTNFIEADFALINGARDVPHAGRRHRATAARGRADPAGRVEDDDDAACRPPPTASRITTAPRTSTRWSIRPSSPATPRCTSSR